MFSVLLTVLSGLFGLFCITREVREIIRAKQIRVRNLVLIVYGITYGIILSLRFAVYDANIYFSTNRWLQFDYSSQGRIYSAWWFVAAVVGYFAFRFGGILRWGQKKKPQKDLRQTVQHSLLLERLQITAVICLFIGVVCFTIWTRGWGGYKNLFLNAASIRNGSYGIKNSVAFFAKPAQIVATVSIISLYLIKQKQKNMWLNVLMFFVSFGLSLLYYLAKDGRMMMAMYLLIVLFMWSDLFEVQENIKKKFSRLILLFAVFVLVVLNMDTLTYYLRNSEALIVEEKASVWQSIMDELLYIYVAGQTALKQYITEGGPLMIGHDVGSAFFAWVPSALTPKGLIDIWNYNTFLIAGSNPMAQYPTDLISTSIYDLGFIGPLVLPTIWGAIVSKLERIKDERNTPLFTVFYYSLSMTLLRAVNYSMMSATVASIFHIFVTAVVFWVVSHTIIPDRSYTQKNR